MTCNDAAMFTIILVLSFSFSHAFSCHNTTLNIDKEDTFSFNPTNESFYCYSFTVFAPDGMRISIKVTNCTLKAIEHYRYLSLNVYDGSNRTHERQIWIGYNTGGVFKEQAVANSSQNSILLLFNKLGASWKFDANALVQVHVTTFPASHCDCPSKPFTGAEGGYNYNILSPLYMNNMNYCNNFNCTYVIILDKAYRVKLDVNYFYTQPDKDLLIAYDGGDTNSEILYNISGYRNYFNFKGTTNMMTLQFITDASITHTGFLLHFDFFRDGCGCPSPRYLESYGELRSPGFPYPWRQCDSDDMEKNCTYLVIGDKGQTIFLNFTAFNLNNDSYLEIFDSESEGDIENMMANLTWHAGVTVNHTDFMNFTSISNRMLLHFVLVINNDLTQHFHSGFQANYWLIDNDDTLDNTTFPYFYIIPLGMCSILLFTGIGYFCHKRIQKHKRKEMLKIMKEFYRRKTTINEYSHEEELQCESSDSWEIHPLDLDIDWSSSLGCGAFGCVYKARLRNTAAVSAFFGSHTARGFINPTVAVKVLGEHANIHSREVFLQEIECMKSIGYCEYLVNLLGCCTKGENYILVMELCETGDLLSYVKTKEGCQKIVINEFNSFAWQIASGMEYLSSHHLVHRDLAARNILLDKEKRAKIGDFGLCRLVSQEVYVTHGGRLPIKWMAIESIRDHLFTHKSDVWSFGVLLYEMYSFGEQPLQFIEPRDVLQLLLDGDRLEKPEKCPDKIYNLMKWCWRERPEDRPSFGRLREKLAIILEENNSTQVTYLDVASL